MSNSLWPHGLQHARLPCPSLSPRVYSNSCPFESVIQSNHLHLHRPFLLLPSIFPSIRVFSNESALHIRWPKNWSFSFTISPSNEYSWLISFRIDWFDLLAVQGALKSLIQHHISKSINSSVLSFLYGPTLTSIHDCWKNHSFDYMDLCWPYFMGQQTEVQINWVMLQSDTACQWWSRLGWLQNLYFIEESVLCGFWGKGSKTSVLYIHQKETLHLVAGQCNGREHTVLGCGQEYHCPV